MSATGAPSITNWHLLSEAEEKVEDEEAGELLDTPAVAADAAVVAQQVLPLTPGRATGNSLDVLDRRWARGNVLSFLSDLPELMVFNDEAHRLS